MLANEEEALVQAARLGDKRAFSVLAERLELRRTLLWAVEQLSSANRETVLLFYYEDFDLRETASALRISVNTVKGRLHRARKHLHQLLSVSLETEKGPAMIPVTRVDVVLREATFEDYTRQHYQLVLMDEAQHRALIIWIGEFEGLVIASKLNGFARLRPMTQAFMSRLIEASGAVLERVEINELKDKVFYATAQLRVNGDLRSVDARPSDAIALALYNDAPLFVSEQVLSDAGIPISDTDKPTGRGLAEFQERMDRIKTVEATFTEQYKDKPEAQLLLSIAFAEADS